MSDNIARPDSSTATRAEHGPLALLVPADRLTPVGVTRGTSAGPAAGPLTLLAGEVADHPRLWDVYRRGLFEAYLGIGAAELAPGPERPTVATTVVLAVDRTGQVVGGCRVRDGTDIHREVGLIRLAPGIGAAIGERERDGVDEGAGSWHVPEAAGIGLGTALLIGLVRAARRANRRWTVAVVNQLGQRAVERAGFVPDPRFVDLPYPDERFRSTLVWYDHGVGCR